MRHDDREINSVNDLLTSLRELSVQREVVWFRGHANKDWRLAPSLARNVDHLPKETELIKRFIQLAVPHLTEDPPRNDWEWIFLMQHHRVPTRLLDWTESPLAAMWFAVSSSTAADNTSDGAFWCLAPLSLNKEAGFRGRLDTELPGFGKDEVLDSWLPDRQDRGVTQNPVAATGPRTSRRMAAQLGNFTISDRGSDAIELIGKQKHIWRFIIPANAKATIAEELNLLRFTELTLFPDLDRVATLTKELLA
ncbi:FRG domain-containing protein [Acidithiobacillus ferrivorans]|uniref:FRG domain-containing protein n=1 Tax=Acidithiobacillus ferrivorans TaxID=160808 RepID=UPI001C06D387|nr:FRG domain-containing protein [Acidithiobacillus ferrivorans]MBU2850856.1 FRG domain-containing protein [Acidithiobacillus ferrivorans]